MNHFSFAYRNIIRRRFRSFLTILGVAVAIGSFITLVGLSRSVQRSALESLDERGAHLTVSQREAADLFSGALPQDLEQRFWQVPGVVAVGGELLALASTGKTHVLAAGWTEKSFFWPPASLLEGRNPLPNERGVVIVGEAIARSLKLEIGSDLQLLGRKLKVIGIVRYTSLLNKNMASMPLLDLQEAVLRRGVVTFFYLRLKDPNNRTEMQRATRAVEAIANVSVSPNETILRDDKMIGFLNAISDAMAVIALFMGALMVLNTLLMAVMERTRDIGILAAIGWSSKRILGSVVLEGLLLSACGGLVGILLGWLGSYGLAAVPTIGRYIAVEPDVRAMALSFMAALGLGVLGSAYPAWRATRQDPSAALQRI